MSVTLETCLVRSPNAACVEHYGEVVILSLTSKLYFGLTSVGARIWEELAEPRRMSDIVRSVEQAFTVEHADCAKDVFKFVEELVEAGLVSEAPAS